MNSLIPVVIAFFLASAHAKSLVVENQVHVQLYYESLCPGCRKFISEQLYPTYATLGSEYIELELIPYGFASETLVNGTILFDCQHGPEECYGNKIYSCAIDLYPIEESAHFVFCSENATDPTDKSTFERCAKTVGLSWSKIQDCLDSGRADQLLSANGKKTNLVYPPYVPYPVIDGKPTDESFLDDFKSAICELLGHPSICNR